MGKHLDDLKKKLSGIRDAEGNAIDERQLIKEHFLAPHVDSRAALNKSRMTPDPNMDRELLAKACESMAELMATFRPSLAKASKRNESRSREVELLEAARKLRAMIRRTR